MTNCFKVNLEKLADINTKILSGKSFQLNSFKIKSASAYFLLLNLLRFPVGILHLGGLELSCNSPGQIIPPELL